MADDPNCLLQELRDIINKQQELIRLVLHLLSEGPAELQGERLESRLERDKARAVAATAMGAGQTTRTILRLSQEGGIVVRDMYPLARAAVESYVNAAFFATQPVEVAQRAIRYKDFAAWKYFNRVIGSGEFMIAIGSKEKIKPFLEHEFPEFSGKGQGGWTSHDVPSRIRLIGEKVGAAGGALLGAYGGVYAISSEIIHGSVFGTAYFYSSGTGDPRSEEGFRQGVLQQRIDILSAVAHAASGFLAAYAETEKMGSLVLTEHEIFKRLFRAVTGDDWE
ncbi:hypothetical protein GCM10008164_35150 [Achromobacter xylosoxidans]|nr:hypothetical protein GCM10008164_35150 [Achromobacter xylosoxidans]